jgi:hypothetical protein
MISSRLGFLRSGAPTFSPLGYTRLWCLTEKATGNVTGTAASDTGVYAVKWWDGTTTIYNSGDTFSKAASGKKAFDVYPAQLAFVDSSAQSHNVAINGSVQLSTEQSKFGDKSAFFTGNGGYLTISSNSAFGMGTGDFTIEMFVYPTEQTLVGGLINFGTYDNGLLWRHGYNVDQIYVTADGGSVTGHQNWGAIANAPLNTWTHIAMVRSSGTIKVYANGVAVLTFASSENLGASKGVMIGACAHNANEAYFGYIDSLRVIKGSALYTSNFTPPSSALTAVSGTVLLLNFDALAISTTGQFDGFNVSNNGLTKLRAESVSLATSASYYQSGQSVWSNSYWTWQPGAFIPGSPEQGNLSDNSLNAAALNQFYTDLLSGSGALYVAGNPGIDADTPTVATAKGYTVFGSVPP